ncbi:MAG TPA: hypothetical protein VJH69_01590 [Candidatus Paceibacterota bacterium]
MNKQRQTSNGMKYFIQTMLVLGFIAMAVFGLYMPFAIMGHDSGCPLASGGAAICGETLLHISHWQAVFAATLAELTIIFAFVVAVFVFRDPAHERERDSALYFLHNYTSPRPTLLQELFAQGILNRRAP